MKTQIVRAPKSSLIKLFAVCATAAALSGCMSAHVQQVEDDIQIARQGPKELPKRNITDFSRGLRCMDDLFVAFGASQGDYPVLAENISDKTKKVNVGSRNMLFNALAGMNARSRAINVNAFGQEVGTAVALLAETGNKGAYQNVPPFVIAGAITQYDDGLIKKQADISGETAGTWNGRNVGAGGGASQSLGATVMGIDMHVITTHNFALLPGVHTRNTVTLYTGGSSQSYDAGINKTGVSYSISTNHKDGVGQALRALIELSSIELIGKLAKLPYWQCLGLDPEHEEIRNEISDWYYQLSQSQLLNSTMKAQMYLRGYFVGNIDEELTEDYLLAILRYKQRLGLPLEPTVDIEFYTAFLNETPTTIPESRLAYVKKNKHSLYEDVFAINKRRAEEAALQAEHDDAQATRGSKRPAKRATRKKAKKAKPVELDATPAVHSSENMQLLIADANQKQAYAPGDRIEMMISANTAGYVSCYFQRGPELVKVFPNRFSTNGFVASKGVIYMPDSSEYFFEAEQGANERLLCYLTKRPMVEDLPARVAVEDFTQLNISSEAELSEAYRRASNNLFSVTSYEILVP